MCEHCAGPLNRRHFDYTSFPNCTPIIIEKTFHAWGEWSSWSVTRDCPDRKKLRSRSRRCEPGNTFSTDRICNSDDKNQTDEHTFRCLAITSYSLRTGDLYNSGTTGSVRLEIQQPHTSTCTTNVLLDGPWKSTPYSYGGQRECYSTFHLDDSLSIFPTAPSSNSVQITQIHIYMTDGHIFRYLCGDIGTRSCDVNWWKNNRRTNVMARRIT